VTWDASREKEAALGSTVIGLADFKSANFEFQSIVRLLNFSLKIDAAEDVATYGFLNEAKQRLKNVYVCSI
jgi:hypothetical protein